MNAPRFNHAYSFAFEVISNDDRGEDVTADMLRSALMARLNRLDEDEMIEACGCPWDTFEQEEV